MNGKYDVGEIKNKIVLFPGILNENVDYLFSEILAIYIISKKKILLKKGNQEC